MNYKIFLAGPSGAIGRRLVPLLCSAGCERYSCAGGRSWVRILSRGLLEREGSNERISSSLRSSRGYLALAVFQIQLAGTYELVEHPLKRIFHMGVLIGAKVTNRN
jgi:hypothetical protein